MVQNFVVVNLENLWTTMALCTLELHLDTSWWWVCWKYVFRQDKENTELEPESNKESGESVKRTVKQRSELLKNYKQQKMKRKLPVDTQLLGCAQEELKIKRQLVEQMDKMDQMYGENMDKMSRNMEKITESIADSFAYTRLCPPIIINNY